MKTKTIICLLPLLLSLSDAPGASDVPDQPTPSVGVEPIDEKDVDCKALARAHAALLNGCFSAQREFTAKLNKKPAKRELVQLNYAAGELKIKLIEEEFFDKRIQIDGEGDMVAESSFSCDRMTRNTEGRYELESAEDPERIIFDYDRDNGVLLPFRWEFEEKARFLFKKFHLQAHADYSSVSYSACDTEPDATRSH